MIHTSDEANRKELITSPQPFEVDVLALDRICEELASWENPKAIKGFLNQAEAVRHVLRSARMGLDLINRAAEAKIRAERRLGQLLAEMDLRGGDRVSNTRHMRTTLKELRISRVQSSRYQKEAEVPEAEFRKLVTASRERKCELTTAALLRLATVLRKRRQVETTDQRPLPRRRARKSSNEEILAELENHCVVFDGILSEVYDALGPVDLHLVERKHLRRLVREFRSLIDDLKNNTTCD